MLDLIFAGSATRHPVNYAEAEVVFNNEGDVFGTGTDKVTVARRIFRSKESDFLIDGNDVQLRDVEELLTSTGLGFRHYPFIGQGEMSRIFTMKPEERKGLFEEVAGIAEYKQRKRDTLVKLEETRVNIARVEDLLAELNGNYAHLGIQAAAAREYVGYQSRLRDLDMDIAHARYLSVLREQERATARLAEAQEKMVQVITSLNGRQGAHDDLQTAQRKISASLREKASALRGAGGCVPAREGTGIRPREGQVPCGRGVEACASGAGLGCQQAPNDQAGWRDGNVHRPDRKSG